MAFSITSLIPARLREQWRLTQRRIDALEKKQEDLEMFLDLLLADAEHSDECSVGLHAQAGRREIAAALVRELDLEVAVETGTFIGNSTNYLARTFDIPVHSSELVPRHHHAAKRMLRNVPNAKLYLQDSRQFLRRMANEEGVAGKRAFFYLDAHWYKDLPLEEEIEIIAGSWSDYAILIDDFEVPGDPGYKYDRYGPGKTLNLPYVRNVVAKHRLSVYSPTRPAAEETGGRAGYAVVLPETCRSVAERIPLLRQVLDGCAPR